MRNGASTTPAFLLLATLFASSSFACAPADLNCDGRLSQYEIYIDCLNNGGQTCVSVPPDDLLHPLDPKNTGKDQYKNPVTKAPTEADRGVCRTADRQPYPCGETPPPPLKGPPPNDPNRAEDWVADHKNYRLYDDKVVEATQFNDYKKEYIGQGDAFLAHSNVLVSCAGYNLVGRDDTYCAANPTDPECTGINSSLQNAVFCNSPPPPGSPAGTPCQSYGAYGFDIDEWLVFSQHYYNGMGHCIQIKDGPDLTRERKGRMENHGDIAGFSTFPPTPMPGMGTEKKGVSASTVTGDTKKLSMEDLPTWQLLADKYDDGAAYLGYERGELIQRAAKGQSFVSAFSESPFAEKLAQGLRDTVDYALGNPKDTMAKAKDKQNAIKEKNGEQVGGGVSKLADGERQPAGSTISVSPLEKIENSAAVPGSDVNAKAFEEKKSQLPSGAATPGAPGSGTKSKNWLALSLGADGTARGPMSEAAMADEAKREAAAAATLAAKDIPAAKETVASEDDVSLFKRVSISYRKYSPRLQSLSESKTARDIRLTDTPALFKDL